MPLSFKKNKICFVASPEPKAQLALARLTELYPPVPAEKAKIVIALGGDGFMLETLHQFLKRPVKIFGMNLGSVGFLMNAYDPDHLLKRLKNAVDVTLIPLKMKVKYEHGEIEAVAFNEVSVLRETRQAAKLKIRVDGRVRLEEMICDGVLLSTPAGSTAYNLSAHGPIVPIGAGILALTPISSFRPRRWRGALLPHTSKVEIDVMSPQKRPVSAVADFTEVRDATHVSIEEDASAAMTLLFDPETTLQERVLKEQFLP